MGFKCLWKETSPWIILASTYRYIPFAVTAVAGEGKVSSLWALSSLKEMFCSILPWFITASHNISSSEKAQVEKNTENLASQAFSLPRFLVKQKWTRRWLWRWHLAILSTRRWRTACCRWRAVTCSKESWSYSEYQKCVPAAATDTEQECGHGWAGAELWDQTAFSSCCNLGGHSVWHLIKHTVMNQLFI